MVTYRGFRLWHPQEGYVWLIKDSTALPHPAVIRDVHSMPGERFTPRYDTDTSIPMTRGDSVVFATYTKGPTGVRWQAEVVHRNSNGRMVSVACNRTTVARLQSWMVAGQIALTPPMTAAQVRALPQYAKAIVLIEAYRQGLRIKGLS